MFCFSSFIKITSFDILSVQKNPHVIIWKEWNPSKFSRHRINKGNATENVVFFKWEKGTQKTGGHEEHKQHRGLKGTPGTKVRQKSQGTQRKQGTRDTKDTRRHRRQKGSKGQRKKKGDKGYRRTQQTKGTQGNKGHYCTTTLLTHR